MPSACGNRWMSLALHLRPSATSLSGPVSSPNDTSQPRAQDFRGDVREDKDDIVDTNFAWFRARIATHEAGLEILKKQLIYYILTTTSYSSRVSGRSTSAATWSIMLHVESIGRKRSTTWVRPSDPPRKRRHLDDTLGQGPLRLPVH
ncbi:hypothetical protein EV715DRAFT_292221 [Schizophyllum commune]